MVKLSRSAIFTAVSETDQLPLSQVAARKYSNMTKCCWIKVHIKCVFHPICIDIVLKYYCYS